MGKCKGEIEKNSVTSLLLRSENISDLWTLESIGITDPCEQQDKQEFERAALEHFRKTLRSDREGRYEVKLPWILNAEELPNNREVAEKRLLSATSKLVKQDRFQSYDAVFKEWLKEGIIEESTEGPGHYLPHRGVFKTHSTTKVRPVYGASCKTNGNLSLNDCLLKGPNLLEVIPSVLLRFRREEIGVVSDIKKAFLQISVSEDDQRFLKFLWWKDREKKIVQVFQHCRVVFGLNCSPFLLGAVIHPHLDQYVSSPHQEVAGQLKTSLYVDNSVTSVKSEDELQQFIKHSTEIMAAAKFDLRGWEFTEARKPRELKEPTPVLGLMWDRSEDVLLCDDPKFEPPEGMITRRVIMSVAQRIFDPIGFTCSVTLYPKLLLQESWQSKLSWDAEVPENTTKKFLKWVEDLKGLQQVRIPKKDFLSRTSNLSLHVFCDASGLSYAAVVYLRCQEDLDCTVQLLMAKSRVAPLKGISMPRLELLRSH